MLLFGPRAPQPDLSLIMQFLIDDLRFDGRTVSWLALKGNSLRLRVDGYELVLAHTEGALPPQAFFGVIRPAIPHLADPSRDGDGPPDGTGRDLARGRVLHSLRHHPCALSVLLRPRAVAPVDTGDTRPEGDSMLALMRECRALLEPVIEAAPPATVIWQPGAVAYTCEEFLANRAEALALPGDTARPLLLPADRERPRNRPALDDAMTAAASGIADLPAPVAATAPAESARPLSRSDRAARRSAGQLFAHGHRSGRPSALPRLHRQDARLAQAFRAAPDAGAEAAARARRRRLNLARVANVAALLLWYMLLLPPAVGSL